MDFNGMDTSALAPMELYDSIFWGMLALSSFTIIFADFRSLAHTGYKLSGVV